MANTSWSGRSKGTKELQSRPSASSQLPEPSNLRISPVSGWLGVEPGGNEAAPPLGVTSTSGMTIVWLPECSMAAYTVEPSGVTASARGLSPNSTTTSACAEGVSASMTHTSLRPTPGVVSCGSKGRAWPRCAQATKILLPALPPTTMSRGSSPTRIVATTRAVAGLLTSTRLTLSDRWLDTHSWLLPRAASATGSSPTATTPARARLPSPNTSKISTRLSWVLAAYSRVPSADNASGRTGTDSNRVYDPWANTGTATSSSETDSASVPRRRGAGAMRRGPNAGRRLCGMPVFTTHAGCFARANSALPCPGDWKQLLRLDKHS